MKKAIILTFVIISSFMLCACSLKSAKKTPLQALYEKDEILIGVKTDSKPFGFIENGKNVGFDIDVANYITGKLFEEQPAKKITFVPVSAQNKIMKLNSGEIDFIVAIMSITPTRESVVDFSVPYYVAGQAIMVEKTSKIRTVENLNNQNVVVVLGTTGERTLRQLAPNAVIRGAKDYSEALEALKSGQAAAIFGDDSVLYGILMDNPDLKILNKRYTKEYYAVAIRKEENNESLKTRLNSTLEMMQKEGVLNKIKRKWIPNASLKEERLQ